MVGIFSAAHGAHAVLIVVALGGNFLLSHENFAAHRALGAVGETGFRAGGCLAGNGDIGVALGGNFLLGLEDLTAYRALGAIGEAGFRAGGRFAGNGHFGMFSQRQFDLIFGGLEPALIIGEVLVALLAVPVVNVALDGASGGFGRNGG